MLLKTDHRIYFVVSCTLICCLFPAYFLVHYASAIQQDIRIEQGHLETTCTVMKFSKFEPCCTDEALESIRTIRPGDGFQEVEYQSCIPDGYFTHCFVTADDCGDNHLSPNHFEDPPCLPSSIAKGDQMECYANCQSRTYTFEVEEFHYGGLMAKFFLCAFIMLLVTFAGSYLVMYISHQERFKRNIDQTPLRNSFKFPLDKRRDPANEIQPYFKNCAKCNILSPCGALSITSSDMVTNQNVHEHSVFARSDDGTSTGNSSVLSIGGSVTSEKEELLSWMKRKPFSTRTIEELSIGGSTFDDNTVSDLPIVPQPSFKESIMKSEIISIEDRRISTQKTTITIGQAFTKRDPTMSSNPNLLSEVSSHKRRSRVTWSQDEVEYIDPERSRQSSPRDRRRRKRESRNTPRKRARVTFLDTEERITFWTDPSERIPDYPVRWHDFETYEDDEKSSSASTLDGEERSSTSKGSATSNSHEEEERFPRQRPKVTFVGVETIGIEEIDCIISRSRPKVTFVGVEETDCEIETFIQPMYPNDPSESETDFESDISSSPPISKGIALKPIAFRDPSRLENIDIDCSPNYLPPLKSQIDFPQFFSLAEF